MTFANISEPVKSSISPVSNANIGDAMAAPVEEHVELGEDRERAKVEEVEPVQDIPETHAEVRKPRLGRRPLLPTTADIDEHFPLQILVCTLQSR